MKKLSLETLVGKFIESGFSQKAITSDKEMAALAEAFDSKKGVLDTPVDELRYIEGLTELPFGYIEFFKVIPAEGYAKCACGRIPSALEIVNTALKRKVHDKALIRDTLIGFENVLDISPNGRQGECISCGRVVLMGGYRKKGYMYALV